MASGPVSQEIDKVVSETQECGYRYHLGASVLGQECPRALFYIFRWYHDVKHKGPTLRLFERGQMEEHRFVKYLKAIGAKVAEVDPRTSKQWRVLYHSGTIGGSADAVLNLPEKFLRKGNGLAEFKTHGEKSFNALLKSDVRTSKPTHFVQMQIYMYLLNLPWALYLAVNKNTDELYDEFVPLIPVVAQSYLNRGREIVDAVRPPPRISEDSNYWTCKFCDFKRICHENAEPDVNCRTCRFSELILEPNSHVWYCHKYGADIPEDFSKKGCNEWDERSS